MALPQSAVSELLEAFRAGQGLDLIRESVRMVLQELIEAEASEVIGAARYERTTTRTTHRNGHRDRQLSTQAGDVSLRIPKLRQGGFFPVILEPRRRIDQACTRWSWKPMCTVSPPGRSTTWSPPWASTRGSPSPKCRGSAPGWTRRSARSGPAPWGTPASPT